MAEHSRCSVDSLDHACLFLFRFLFVVGIAQELALLELAFDLRPRAIPASEREALGRRVDVIELKLSRRTADYALPTKSSECLLSSLRPVVAHVARQGFSRQWHGRGRARTFTCGATTQRAATNTSRPWTQAQSGSRRLERASHRVRNTPARFAEGAAGVDERGAARSPDGEGQKMESVTCHGLKNLPG